MKKKLNLRKETVAVLAGRQLGAVYGGATEDTFASDCLCASVNAGCRPGKTNGCMPFPDSKDCTSFPCPMTAAAPCEFQFSVGDALCFSNKPKSCPCQGIPME